ncbi:hypothetical protein AAFN60_18180 [Roseibacillus persicicus]|uniref:hypothetical protein n=1 Tax=Roseibacillus persicicus TaxID=454148 RepID=UPI00398A783A
MTEVEAFETLALHSGSSPNVDDPRFDCGFLGSLRPYKGTLDENNFREVMDAMLTLRTRMMIPGKIGLEAIKDVHRILDLARHWALHPEGMLRRNNLIEEGEMDQMSEWLNIMSGTWKWILDGADDETILGQYNEYKARG